MLLFSSVVGQNVVLQLYLLLTILALLICDVWIPSQASFNKVPVGKFGHLLTACSGLFYLPSLLYWCSYGLWCNRDVNLKPLIILAAADVL